MAHLRVAAGVGEVEDGDTVYAARLPDGPIVVLAGTAAVVWRAASRGRRDTLAARVAEQTEASEADIAPDVTAFVDALLAQGLLIDEGE